MSDVKHSPTPWTFERIKADEVDEPDYVSVMSADGKLICLLGPGNLTGRDLEERIVNMEFTARACSSHDELVSACESMATLLQKLIDMDRLPANVSSLREGRAAIAKATEPAPLHGE